VKSEAVHIESDRYLEGWRPETGFERGLEATVRWYVDHRGWWEAILARKGELAFDWTGGAAAR